ncbi:MAG: hypothetical protein L0H93_12630, partial [Nocardioides sp.]|nr:hypothetical protein [Nocardioides sp.]
LSDVFASIRLRGRVHIARVMSAGARATRRYNARRVAAQVNQSRELSPLMFATVGLVELPRSVRSLELYPAPRTSFDVAIGTCTEDDQTIVTARSRASQHTVADLQELLELLRNELLWGRLRDQSD